MRALHDALFDPLNGVPLVTFTWLVAIILALDALNIKRVEGETYKWFCILYVVGYLTSVAFDLIGHRSSAAPPE
jgi:hypothetical protein